MAYVQNSGALSIMEQVGAYAESHWLAQTQLAREAAALADAADLAAETTTTTTTTTAKATGVTLPTPAPPHQPSAQEKAVRKRISARNPDACKTFEEGEQSEPEDKHDDHDNVEDNVVDGEKEKEKGDGERSPSASADGVASVTSSPASKTPRRISGLVVSAEPGTSTPSWPGKKCPAKLTPKLVTENEKANNADSTNNDADNNDDDEWLMVESTQRPEDAETVKATRRRRLQRQKPSVLNFEEEKEDAPDEGGDHCSSLSGLTQSPDLFLHKK